MAYIPNSKGAVAGMLHSIGRSGVGELFDVIPRSIRLSEDLPIPPGMSEMEVERHFLSLAKMNSGVADFASFLGAGAYRHFIPSVVDAVASRSEFYTAYTPYQPEVSQGTLQAVFEYQSLVALLTGMDAANASMYDGATAVTEAVLMAHRARGGGRALVAESLHPFYTRVMKTYVRNFEVEVVPVPFGPDGRMDMGALRQHLGKGVDAVVVQSPNFFGVVEDIEAVSAAAHPCGSLVVAAFTEAMSLPLLKPAGACGADVVAGEGQSFGIPLSFGGPYLGVFATTAAHVRRMPGRVVGMAQDTRGDRGFVLTLSTREQHIRREKATSNICSNEGLCALMATVYMSALGRTGLRETAERNLSLAHFTEGTLAGIPGVARRFSGPFFNEFALTLPGDPHEFARFCRGRRIVPGVPLKWFYPALEREMLFCVTEMNQMDEIEALAAALREFAG